jgi:L-threonylcarbamoyladenylate synthase
MPVLDGQAAASLSLAAAALAKGDLVALPTETVYGLGARADDDGAVAKIFAAKGRPDSHPLIVHVADLAAAGHYGNLSSIDIPRLAAAFWPGPLTLIVPRQPGVAQAAAGGQHSIGLRIPSHPVAQALLREAALAGVSGVAAPSANRFGRISPTLAAHVVDEFGPDLMVLDGGACQAGIESTIVDCTARTPALLRPGVIGREAIERVLGRALGLRDQASPRASGTLEAHYAPQAKLRLLPTTELRTALTILAGAKPPQGLAVYSRTVRKAESGIDLRVMPESAVAAAHELFAVLRGFDARGARLIWVEAPPSSPDWDGVRDRLVRAAAA